MTETPEQILQRLRHSKRQISKAATRTPSRYAFKDKQEKEADFLINAMLVGLVALHDALKKPKQQSNGG